MSQNYVAAQTPSQVPTLVTAAPTLPAPTLLSLTQHMPDGSLNTVGAGRTTADTQPALVFVAIPGDTYTLYDNGVLVGTLTAVKDVTGWTLPPLDNGSHALSLTYATADGVSFPLQFAFNVEAAPAAPVITDIHAALGPLEGIVAAGGISTDGHPAINGTGHAGDTINVFDGSTLLGSTSIDASGHWSFTPANALANGGHAITVTETNSAGTSAASAAYPLDVANIMITAVHDANGNPVANGGVTAGAILITGWISDPSIISDALLIDIGGGNVGNASRIMGANFTVTGHTFTVELSADSFTGATGDAAFPTNGTFTIGVEAFGSAGHIATLDDPQLVYTITDNFNAAAQPISNLPAVVTPDPTLPAPYILSVTQHMPDGSINTLAAGHTTADTQPVIAFISIPGDTYTLYDNGVLVGTLTAATDVVGWKLPPLDNGSHAFSLTYATADGVSFPSQYAFNVEATPVVPVITDVQAAAGPLEGTVAAGGISTDSHPAINGTGHAGDTINVFDGSTLLGSTLIDASGHWSFTPANALANGSHSITATGNSSAGTSAASAAYPLDVANIMITAVHDANGHLVANGGVTAGAILITGWISDPSIISDALLIDIGGGNLGYTSRIMGANFTVTGHAFTVELSGNSFTGGVGDGAFPTTGTFTIGVEAFGSAGHIVTLDDPQLVYTITDNFNAAAQPVSATQAAAVTDTADTASAAVTASATTDTSHHVALGEHDAFTATESHATIDLNVDPAAYFAQATAHIQGASGAANTVHLTGDHQVLDLTSLSGHTAASKISGVEAVDLGGAHNTLKLSLSDVLNLGQSDMFQQDGHIQMLVKGSNGDSVDLSNAHIAGISDGQWTQEGASVIGGVTYNVYEHSGAHAELLVQQGVQIALHA